MSNPKFDERLARLLTSQAPTQRTAELPELRKSWSPTASSTKMLADACRDEEWRTPIAEAGFLASVLNLDISDIASSDAEFAIQIMRFVGNAVAYCDENRAIVLPFMPTMFKAKDLGDEQLRLTSLSAILNLCIDYEPAQVAFVEQELFRYLASEMQTTSRPTIHATLSLINVIFPAFNARNETLPPQFLSWALLETSRAPGIVSNQQDDFLHCTDSFLPMLRDDGIQKTLAAHIAQVLELLENTVVRLAGRRRAIGEDEPDEEEIAELESCADELVGVVANVAFYWSFESQAELLADDDLKEVQRWLAEEWQSVDEIGNKRSEDNIRFARAAALVLGNVVMKSWVAEAIVQETKIVEVAIRIINDTKDRELLNASAGLLRNLAVPRSTKDVIQTKGAFEAATKLITPSRKEEAKVTAPKFDVEITTAGLRLLHVLLLDSSLNCKLFLTRNGDPAPQDAVISLLQDNEDLDPRIKAEAGRLIVAVLRTFTISPSLRSEQLKPTSKPLIDETPEAISAVATLISHPDPRNKSAGWMGLGLLSRTKAGAEAIYAYLAGSDDDILTPFHELFQATEGPDRPALGRDQDNALVIIANIMNVVGDRMGSSDAEALKSMLSKHGGK